MQGLGARSRRDLLRKTWVPQGKSLKDLEEEKSVVIRFVVGYRCRPKQPPAHVLPSAPLPEQSFIPGCRLLTTKSVQAVPDLQSNAVRQFSGLLKLLNVKPALPDTDRIVQCVRSEQKDDPDELRIQEEIKLYGDILRLDMVDTYADLSMKTLKMFSVLPAKFDADFYFKIDDDVAVNVDAMATYLQAKRNQGNLYLVSNHMACWRMHCTDEITSRHDGKCHKVRKMAGILRQLASPMSCWVVSGSVAEGLLGI